MKENFRKKYGNTKQRTLDFKLTLLKQELKATCKKLKTQKRNHERKSINRRFFNNPKGVYRDFKGSNIRLEKIPTKDEVQSFRQNIWQRETKFNKSAKWLGILERTYCKSIIPTKYEIERETLDKLINDMQLNKSRGRDLITSFWYKKLYFYRDKLTELYQSAYSGEEHLPPWLPQARTKLLTKNEITDVAKNYRPIAWLNLMYKIYTSFLNTFLSDHCYKNQIISPGQAAGKKGVWGCTEQLLINKAIMTEVRKKRRNLFTIWLDYKKAFDSVPHEWLIYALKLAKVPPQLVSSIEHLITQWCTVVHLGGENDSITTDIIQFMKGIFQGDSLSVLLFILTANPLSFLFRNLKGYQYGTKRNSNVTHNFFVDDLKLYANNINTTRKLLDLVTIFSKDTGMTFGEDKCAYQQIVKGKLINNTKERQISDLKIKPISEGDSYKY